jgi:outer membrane protein assembly factor BamB/tetratricopeptide (TPR) repeat protein
MMRGFMRRAFHSIPRGASRAHAPGGTLRPPAPALAAAALALLAALPAAAQEEGQAYVPRDDQVDAALRQSRDLEAKGRAADAVRALLRAEARLEELRRQDPTARIVVPREGERDLFDGAERAIRERLLALPAAALTAYRADRDPRAAALLARAEADLGDARPLEELVARYPLAESAPRAWELLADLRIERGAFGDALAALEARHEGAEEPALSPAERARLDFVRARVRGAGRDLEGLASWPMEGGAPDRSRRAAGGPVPGAPILSAALPIPEAGPAVVEGWARRGRRPPLVSHAVSDGSAVFVADSKSVVAFDLETRSARWIYVAVGDGAEVPEPPLLPERLDNMAFAAAAEGGRVYATLNRNTPPIWPELPPRPPRRRPGAEEGGDEEGARPRRDRNKPKPPEATSERRRDWRLVAIDARTGRLVWDAASPAVNGGGAAVPAPGAAPAPAGAPGVPGPAPGTVTVGVPEPAPAPPAGARPGAAKPAPAAASGAATPSLDEMLRTARHVTTPLAAQGRVFFGATTQAQGNLQAYVFALEATSGRPLWRTFIAAGTPDDFRGLASEMAPLALEGGRLVVQTNLGTVAALDPLDGAFLWVSRYRATPAASQKRIIRDDLRFAPAAARIVAGRAVVAPQDSGYLHGLDLRSGREAWRHPRDRATRVAGVSRGRVVLCGEGTLLALDGASGRIAWEAAEPPLGVRGAPFASEDAVYVSTQDAIVVYDASTGARAATLRHGPRGTEPGNLALLGERLAIVTHAGLLLVEPAERSLARLSEAARAKDALASLALGTLLARLDRPGSNEPREERRERAFAALRRVEEIAGREGPGPAREARLEAFRLASDAAEEAFLAKDERAALRWTPRALEVAPADPSGLAFVRDAAERLEAAGRPRDAVQAWRRGLERHADLEVPLAPGVSAPAGPYIRDRLVEMRARHGAAPFVDHDREAARLLELAQRAGTPEAFEDVVLAGAASDSEGSALLALAAIYEKRDHANLAIRHYQRHAERLPDAKEAPRVLLRLAALLERVKRRDEERAVLEALRARFAAEPVPGDPSGARIGALAEARLAALAAQADVPALPLGASEEPGLGRSFQTTPDLDADDPRILSPRGLDVDGTGIFFVGTGSAFEARLVESGALLWRREVPEARRERAGVAGATAVLSGSRVIEGVDLARGVPRWRWGAPGLVQAKPGESPAPSSPASVEPARGAPPAAAAEAPPEPAAAPAPVPATASAAPGGGAPETAEQQLTRARDALASLETLVDPDPLKGVTVVGDKVVAILGRDVLALDAASGKVLWRIRRTESLYKDPIAIDPPRQGALPARVVVASEAPAKLISLDLASGAEVWSLPLGDRDPRITVAPVASRGGRRIFCVVASSDLVAVDGVAGIQLWRRGLKFYARELTAAPDGAAVAIATHPSPDQPRLAVYEGSSGESRFEESGDKGRISAVAFDADRLYLFAGDMLTGKLSVVDWRAGKVEWMWTPKRGETFAEVVVARDHIVLPQTAPLGGGVVYVLDKARRALFRAFALEGRRVHGAAIVRGTLVISTTRGLTGFARIDPARLRDDLSRAAVEAARRPDDAGLRVRIADRRFKLGDIDGAISACEEALLSAGSIAAYDLLDRQLRGAIEARGAADTIELQRLARAPEIDGDLRDVWPFHQSIALDRPRRVQPVQGTGRSGLVRGREDLSATLYMGYDDRYFYFALDVEDSVLMPYDSESEDWRGDCLLIAIDALGDGGDSFRRDDNLLSLALTLPKKNKRPDEEEDEENEPDGRYFVKRKDDGTGAVYEGAIPWRAFIEHQADIDPVRGPKPGFTFGFDVLVTDDDDGAGARKALSWTPGVMLHREKRRLWSGFVPGRFGKIICR